MSNDKVAMNVRRILDIKTKEEIHLIPDVVKRVCEKTCIAVLGMSPYEMQIDESIGQAYANSISELCFIKYITKLCKDTGIDFEPVRDFYGPIDKKRISTILSKLVAFLLFRNAKLKTYEERYGDYLNQFNSAEDRINALLGMIEEDKNELRAANTDLVSADYKLNLIKSEYEEADRKLSPLIEKHNLLKKECEELTEKCADLDKKIEEMKDKSTQIETECSALDDLLREPPAKIRKDIDGIRRNIADKNSEIGNLDNVITDIQGRKRILADISAKINNRKGDIEKISELKRQNKEAKSRSKDLQDKIDKLKAEKESVSKEIDSLGKVKIPKSKAKLTEIRQNRDRKRDEYRKEVDQITKEKEDCESRNSEIINETHKLRRQTQEIIDRVEANRRAFSEEASKAEKILTDLSTNVKSYHKALFNYIPIEFDDGDDDDDDDNEIGDDDDNDYDNDGEANHGYGGLTFRTGNEGNIGTTSEDERDDIYI